MESNPISVISILLSLIQVLNDNYIQKDIRG